MPPAGLRDAHRVEQSAFDEDGGGGCVAAGRLAADYAGIDCTPAASKIAQSSGVAV